MSNKPYCVFLDRISMDCDDLDFSRIQALTRCKIYDMSSNDEIVERSKEASIIISNKVKLGAEHFTHLPKLKLICVIATGTNNIDHKAAEEYGIPIVNVTGYGASAVSQHVFMLILALQTSFIQYQSEVKQGVWQKQSQFCLLTYPIHELKGKTLGLIGYGHIAKAVEKIALGFGMKVIIAKSFNPDNQDDSRLEIPILLQQSDVISLHCPLSEQTQNLIAAKEFEMMKSSAIIINAARGGIINEADLLEALENGQIAGAGIDCIAIEPPADDDPMILANMPQLIITPHNAWGSLQARQRLVDGTAENIENFINQNPA